MNRLHLIQSHLASYPEDEVCIVAMGRSAVHPSGGALKDFTMPELAGQTLRQVLDKYKVSSNLVQGLFMGCVYPAGAGQSPAKQAAVLGGLPDSVNCFTVNKLCASGMKAVTLACMAIRNKEFDCVVAGGAEVMSAYPYTLQARNGIGSKVKDSMGSDVLPDAVTQELPIKIADFVSNKLKIGKKELDDYARLSCDRAKKSQKEGKFNDEIVSVQNPKTKKVIQQDFIRSSESVAKYKEFNKNGTTSVGNTCGTNDGASLIVLTTRKLANSQNLKVLGTIECFADAEQESNKFPLTPTLAIYKLLSKTQYRLADVKLIELNEPFSCVVLGNSMLLDYPVSNINVNGGALALGHPVGSSGCRIIGSLILELARTGGGLGIAAICNGAGGGSAVLVKSEV